MHLALAAVGQRDQAGVEQRFQPGDARVGGARAKQARTAQARAFLRPSQLPNGLKPGAHVSGRGAEERPPALIEDEAAELLRAGGQLVGETGVGVGEVAARQAKLPQPGDQLLDDDHAGELVIEVLEQVVRRAAVVADRIADANALAEMADAGLDEIAAENVAVTVDLQPLDGEAHADVVVGGHCRSAEGGVLGVD